MFGTWRKASRPIVIGICAIGVWHHHRNARSSNLHTALLEGPASESSELPSFSERTIGNYENRIRRFSAPERVFEYFSSVEIDKQYYMTPEDLARAMTPYTFRHGAPLTSKNVKYNLKALRAKPSKVLCPCA